MSSLHRVIAVLVLAVVGLVGCAHEGRSVAGVNPLSAADLKAVMRDLWSGHNFWIRNVALDNTTNNRKALDYADKAATANARQIARVFTPFYGEAWTGQLFTLLVKQYGAIKTYSEATVAGSKKSPIGYSTRQKGTVRALGLRRMGQTVEHNDTPVIRGMIEKVAHLVAVEQA